MQAKTVDGELRHVARGGYLENAGADGAAEAEACPADLTVDTRSTVLGAGKACEQLPLVQRVTAAGEVGGGVVREPRATWHFGAAGFAASQDLYRRCETAVEELDLDELVIERQGHSDKPALGLKVQREFWGDDQDVARVPAVRLGFVGRDTAVVLARPKLESPLLHDLGNVEILLLGEVGEPAEALTGQVELGRDVRHVRRDRRYVPRIAVVVTAFSKDPPGLARGHLVAAPVGLARGHDE